MTSLGAEEGIRALSPAPAGSGGRAGDLDARSLALYGA